MVIADMTKKYNTNLERTTTMEFHVDDDKILHVIYNIKDYIFTDFWQKAPDAEKVCQLIYEEFQKQHPDKFKMDTQPHKNWVENLIRIINKHLNIYDSIMDIFIRHNGEVTFKLER